MAYRLLYHPDVFKVDISKLPANIKQRLRRAIEERLLKSPVLSGLPLRRTLKGYRKIRVGDYRIIYRVKGKDIIILKIGHRKEIYLKTFLRLSRE